MCPGVEKSETENYNTTRTNTAGFLLAKFV